MKGSFTGENGLGHSSLTLLVLKFPSLTIVSFLSSFGALKGGGLRLGWDEHEEDTAGPGEFSSGGVVLEGRTFLGSDNVIPLNVC